MKKLNKFILKSFSRPFVISFAVVLFILVLQFLSRYKDDLFGKGIETIVIMKVFLFASASLVVLALPLAILLSSLMTMGNMGEHYELAAIKSCGISLFRVIKPMFYMTVLITLFSFWFSFFVIPRANLKLYSLLYDLGEMKAALKIEPGHFYDDIDNYVIRIRDKDVDTERLYGVMIYEHTESKPISTLITADSAEMFISDDKSFMIMNLFHGTRQEEMNEEKGEAPSYPFSRYYFDTLIYRFELSGFGLNRTDEDLFKSHQLMLNIFELMHALDSLDTLINSYKYALSGYMRPIIRMDSAKIAAAYASPQPVPDSLKKGMLAQYPPDAQKDLLNRAMNNARAVKNYTEHVLGERAFEEETDRKYAIEFHTKFAMPLACIIFLLIGAPLGAIIRKGGIGMPVIVSILFFIFFYVLMIQGKKFAKDGVMDVMAGVWLPIIVLTPIAIFLTYESASESRILDSNLWYKAWQPIVKVIKAPFRKKEMSQ